MSGVRSSVRMPNRTRRPALLALVAAALVTAGCRGGSEDADRDELSTAPPAAPRPALCTNLRDRVTGRVHTPAATELSGLVLSRSQKGVLWAHNDSGDSPRLLAISPEGRMLGEVPVAGAQNADWEDIALGPRPGGGDALYVGDIGDNEGQRSSVVLYRLAEPRVGQGASAEPLVLRYRDGAHDAEALLVDPSSGSIVVITKSFDGVAGVYVADPPKARATTALRRVGEITLNAAEPVTAASLSADGRTIVIRTYDGAFLWSRRKDESLVSALRRRPCAANADLLVEGQGETIALTADGRAFYTVPEGEGPELRRWSPSR